MPVLSNNDGSDSDTVDNLATAEQPDSKEVLFQETVENKKGMLRMSCLLIQKTR